MRLLVLGHLSHTGFGVVTEALASRFVNAGVDVRVIAVNHRGEPVRGALAGRVWPAAIAGQGYGGNISHQAIDGSLWRSLDADDEWQPDRVLVISDMSGLFGHVGPKGISGPWADVPVYHYCPIEGDNLPTGWRKVWQQVQPVAMSKYGQRVIEQHIGRSVPMIYHGVDADTFRPVTQRPIQFGGKALRTREDCKRAFGLDPARKVILRTDRNVERKFYPALLRTMATVFDRDPDVDLVLHCRPIDEGQNLIEEIGRLADHNPAYVDRIKLTNAHDTWRGLPTEGLVALINAADLYVSTTGGEGFGLTLAESLACGVPVVVTGWAAETEVAAEGGVLVPPLHDQYGEPVRYHSGYGMDWAVPDVRAFPEPILRLLGKPALRRSLGVEGRMHVRRSFNWDAAAVAFLEMFTQPAVAAA